MTMSAVLVLVIGIATVGFTVRDIRRGPR